jgi:hypothetical protein
VNLCGTVGRHPSALAVACGGVFEALHAAVAAAAARGGELRVELSQDLLPLPLRVYCGGCKRCCPLSLFVSARHFQFPNGSLRSPTQRVQGTSLAKTAAATAALSFVHFWA